MRWTSLVTAAVAMWCASACAVDSSAPGEPEQTDDQGDEIGKGQSCGNVHCGKGSYCCNASCGICAPIGGGCIQIACAPEPPKPTCDIMAKCMAGYEWSDKACTCVPIKGGGKPGSCTTSADCRLEADYCTGCDCRALSTNQNLPACSGPGVKCFADPCMNKAAACVDGACQVTSTL